MTQLLPLPIQTMCAELAERAQLGQMAEDFDPAGSFIKRTIRGCQYWYFRSAMAQGSRPEKYVGPDSPELEQRIARHRVEKTGYKERRGLVSALIRSGLRGPDARTGRILEALAKAGVFRMRAVVVGTAAYQTYPGLIGARLPAADAMTDDLDLAQFHGISIAIGDAVDVPFLDILRRVDPDFQPLTPVFAPGRASRFALGDRYRVDILTPMQGPSDASLVELPALKADTQPLRFLDFLIYQEIQAVSLWGAGIPINVPAPERYALHKLLVSHLRLATPESQAKAATDIPQAGDLITVLAAQRPYEIRDIWEELTSRGRKWRRLGGGRLAGPGNRFINGARGDRAGRRLAAGPRSARGAASGRGRQRVLQQTRHRHRPHASGHGRDRPSHRRRRLKCHVADKPPVRQPVNANIDHCRAGLDPVGRHHFRPANRGNQDIGPAALSGQVERPGMRDRHRRVRRQQQ